MAYTAPAVRTLRREYLESHPQCQITQAVGRHVMMPRHIHRQACVHHLWGRKGKHSEHWSNYVTVLPGPHDWAHANPKVGRIALTWFKWQLAKRTGDERHFDLAALKRASGWRVPGWVEMQLAIEDSLPAWCRRMGEELVRGCE